MNNNKLFGIGCILFFAIVCVVPQIMRYLAIKLNEIAMGAFSAAGLPLPAQLILFSFLFLLILSIVQVFLGFIPRDVIYIVGTILFGISFRKIEIVFGGAVFYVGAVVFLYIGNKLLYLVVNWVHKWTDYKYGTATKSTIVIATTFNQIEDVFSGLICFIFYYHQSGETFLVALMGQHFIGKYIEGHFRRLFY